MFVTVHPSCSKARNLPIAAKRYQAFGAAHDEPPPDSKPNPTLGKMRPGSQVSSSFQDNGIVLSGSWERYAQGRQYPASHGPFLIVTPRLAKIVFLGLRSWRWIPTIWF